LAFPDKDVALTFFQDMSDNFSISTASQNDLQVVLDVHQYNQLLTSLNI